MIKRILIVEDDTDLRLMYMLALRNPDYEFSLAADAEQAMRDIDECNPDLVLTDIHMQAMNGIELVRWLRRRNDKIPVIVMSNDYYRAPEAAAAGANGFFYKSSPSIKELQGMVKELIH